MFVSFEHLPGSARVWIYQSARPFTETDIAGIENELHAFVEAWTAHNVSLHAYGGVWFDRFIVLMADESRQEASGCSVDRSVHFLEQLEKTYGLSLFDRKTVVFKDADSDTLTAIPLEKLKENLEKGVITLHSLVFDNLVKTKQQFTEAWIKPLEKSWHLRFV